MASEPKTRPTDVPAADFIAAVADPKRRADAETACALLAEVSGEPPVMWGPSIVGFGSYKGSTGDWPRIGFSPRKAETVFYIMPGFTERADLVERLGKVRTGGSCLYVKRMDAVDQDALRELAQWALSGCARSIRRRDASRRSRPTLTHRQGAIGGVNAGGGAPRRDSQAAMRQLSRRVAGRGAGLWNSSHRASSSE